MSRARVIRLGLFQLVAGGLSVLFLGVLNRVMRVELGLDLFIVSLLIGGGHYLGALIAIPFGFYSDTHPLQGYRRTPYILGSITITVLILIGAPWVVRWVAASPSVDRISLGFLFFLIEGISTYIAGTAYLALITDLTSRHERGRVTGVIWTDQDAGWAALRARPCRAWPKSGVMRHWRGKQKPCRQPWRPDQRMNGAAGSWPNC